MNIDPLKDHLNVDNFCPTHENTIIEALLEHAQNAHSGDVVRIGVLYGPLVEKFIQKKELLKKLKKLGVSLTSELIPDLPSFRFKAVDFQSWEYHTPHCLVLTKA